MKKQFVTLLVGILFSFMIIGVSILIDKNKEVEVDKKQVEEETRIVETSTEELVDNRMEDLSINGCFN